MARTDSSKERRTSKPKKSTEKASKLSAEYIVDSDNDSMTPDAPKPTEKTKRDKSKEKLATSSKKSKAGKDSERGKAAKSTAEPAFAHRDKVKTSKSKASEPFQDLRKLQKAKPKANGVVPKVNGSSKRPAPSDSSESGSGTSGDEAEEEIREKGKQDQEESSSDDDNDKDTGDGDGRKSQSASEPTSSSKDKLEQASKDTSGLSLDGISSDNANGSEEEPEVRLDKSTGQKDQNEEGEEDSEEDATVVEFQPPHGFKKATVGATSEVAAMLSKSSLDGKQIWLITAPKKVPISALKQAAVADLGKSTSVLTHKGVNYGFSESKLKETEERLMVPRNAANSYKAAPLPFSRFLNLHEVLQVPDLGNAQSSSQQPIVDHAANKPKPQQPTGLKMRYRPFGDVDSSDEADSEEALSQPREFRMPPPAQTAQKSKRKAEATPSPDTSRRDSPTKKRKKDKRPSATPDLVNGAQSIEETPDDVEMADAPTPLKKHANETPEEKAARRAARKARKEGKKQKKPV